MHVFWSVCVWVVVYVIAHCSNAICHKLTMISVFNIIYTYMYVSTYEYIYMHHWYSTVGWLHVAWEFRLWFCERRSVCAGVCGCVCVWKGHKYPLLKCEIFIFACGTNSSSNRATCMHHLSHLFPESALYIALPQVQPHPQQYPLTPTSVWSHDGSYINTFFACNLCP